jgi:hypothetical protein
MKELSKHQVYQVGVSRGLDTGYGVNLVSKHGANKAMLKEHHYSEGSLQSSRQPDAAVRVEWCEPSQGCLHREDFSVVLNLAVETTVGRLTISKLALLFPLQ